MTDHTIRIAIMRALGYNDKLPVWEVSPWTGRYEATPSTWTDGAYNSALTDVNGRLIVKAILDSVTGGVTLDVSDRAARLLGLVYGSRNAQLQQKATTFELLTYDDAVKILLGAGLPALLDSGALKIKEQSPITTINIGNYPASYLVTASDLDIRNLTAALDTVTVQGTATVSATHLDIRHLNATDDAVAVSATNLDIRDLVDTTDGVTVAPKTDSVWDVKDRAARLLGIIYGDQGQLAQRATTKELLIDLMKIGGTAQTGADWSSYLDDIPTVKTNTDPLVAAAAGGYVRQDSTGTIAKETGGNLATVKTNTDTLVAAAAGGYVRQDSTATIAKESGGNLASVKTNTDSIKGALDSVATDEIRILREQEFRCQGQVEFVAWSQIQLAAGSSDFPIHLINPNASGKTLYVHQIIGGGQYGAFSMILKYNPTVNVAGAAVTPLNLYIGSATTSVATPKSGSTFTSEGTLMFALNTWGMSPKTYDGMYIIIPPNNSILCKLTNNHTATQYCAATVIWGEV
jgi:hypothetical protein